MNKVIKLRDESIEKRKKIIGDYMSKCPFIEFHSIDEIDHETAIIGIAFDEEEV